MRRLKAGGWALALGVLWAAPTSSAVELVRPEETLLAIFTLETQIEMEERLLSRVQEDYAANQTEREQLAARVDRLYDELEAALEAPEEEVQPDEIAERDRELERLERAQGLARDEGRRLRRGMLESRSRIRLLRDRVAGLLEVLPTATDSLTGYWDVVLLTGEERGIFFLNQSGAVLTGEYALVGGYRGSLQGTVIDGQVVLHRIDTRLGRVMDLDGTVSGDGRKIRGSWRRYDLSSGRPATGAWSATRRSATSADQDEEGP